MVRFSAVAYCIVCLGASNQPLVRLALSEWLGYRWCRRDLSTLTMALELFKIFCILESQIDDLEHAFLVNIAKTETVYDLKEAITKVPGLAKYDARSIVLNRVDILADSDFEKNIKSATQTKLRNPTQKLVAILPTGPQDDMVHIIVKPSTEPPPQPSK
jgi:Crinkler effector protein N-terminal domain